MTLIYTHRDEDARIELDLGLEPTIDPGHDGGRWEPSHSEHVADCEFRVLGVRTLGEHGEVTGSASVDDGTLPLGSAAAIAREFEQKYQTDDDLRAAVDRYILRMEEICSA
jgi:hypothetical protein